MKTVGSIPDWILLGLIFFLLNFSQSVLADKPFWPTKQRWKSAFVNAVQDPHTWVPTAGALLSLAGTLDQDLSEQASSGTPIFGSRTRAVEARHALLNIHRIGMFVSVLAVPDEERPLTSRLYRGAVQGAGILFVHRLAWEVKYAYPRVRPDKSGNHSFFSSYAAGGSAFSAFGKRNLDEVPMSAGMRYWTQAAFSGTSMLLAWSRVEAKKHYLSDVLAGYAVGNFIGRLINDLFLHDETLLLDVSPQTGGLSIVLYKPFS